MLLSFALTSYGTERNLTVVDDRNWEEFDSKISPLSFQCNTKGGTTYFTSLTWYSPDDTAYARYNRHYSEADIPQGITRQLAPYVPSDWKGNVEVHICHAYTLPAYDGMPETITMDFPPAAQEDSTAKRDFLGFRANFNKNSPFPGYPQNIPTTVPDYVLVLDKDENVVFANARNTQIADTPEIGSAIYSAFYFPVNGAATWIKSQFPLRLYFLSFSTAKYEINITADGNGGAISPSGPVTVNHGENASFVITADEGYCIAALLIDGKAVEITNQSMMEYTFTDVNSEHSINARFSKIDELPEISMDKGLNAALISHIKTNSDTEIAAFEKGGFTNGGTVHIVSASGLVTTKTEGTFTADTDGFVQAVKLKVEYEEGAESRGLTLAVKPLDAAKPFSADKKYYALLLNKKTNYYDLFPAALNTAGNLEVAVKPVGDYFSEGTIFVYSGTATDSGTPVTPDTPANPDSGPKSSGGCAAGVGTLALLAALPLLRRRTGK